VWAVVGLQALQLSRHQLTDQVMELILGLQVAVELLLKVVAQELLMPIQISLLIQLVLMVDPVVVELKTL
jgi:hypothetical protein